MAPAGYGDRVEGLHAVSAAIPRITRLYVEKGRARRSEIAAIIDSVGRDRVRLVDDVRLHATSDAPQGVVAECRPILPVTLESLAKPDAAVLVLDHIEDPHNLGAIARSALAAGIDGLVVSARRAAPLSAAAFKTAAGALESLPVAVVGSVPDAMTRLKTLGLWLLGLTADAAGSLFGHPLLTEPVAVVIGAEGEGLSRLARTRCDTLVSIPMIGPMESLNASVSAALAAFEIMRVRTG